MDTTGWINTLAGSSESWMAEVKSSAAASLRLLKQQHSADQAFQAIFLQPQAVIGASQTENRSALPGSFGEFLLGAAKSQLPSHNRRAAPLHAADTYDCFFSVRLPANAAVREGGHLGTDVPSWR